MRDSQANDGDSNDGNVPVTSTQMNQSHNATQKAQPAKQAPTEKGETLILSDFTELSTQRDSEYAATIKKMHES